MTENKTATKREVNTWLDKSTLERANKEVEKWPRWKVEAYDRFYAMRSFSMRGEI